MNSAVFLIDLVQDVAACRPIAEFFRREGGLDLAFLVTAAFRKRDATGHDASAMTQNSSGHGFALW